MSVVIRPIEEKDIREHVEVLNSVIQEREYLMYGQGELTPQEISDFVKKTMQKGIMLVAEVDGRVVGWCDIRPGEQEKNRHVGIMGLGIHKEHRGRGIGSKLVEEALKRAKEKNLAKVELHVFATNARAHALYKKLGLEEEGRQRRSVKIGNRLIDSILMGKFL